MLRMAIIGMGWAGTRHVEAIRELGRKLAVECLVDNDRDFLVEKSRELGIEKTYVDYRDALADPAVEAVSICAPHAMHCPMAIEAAKAHKHILCEKPLALRVKDATKMIRESNKHGVRLYVAENNSYTAQAEFLRKVVQTGDPIGELIFAVHIDGFRAEVFRYPGRREWLTRPELGGTGTWMLHGIHTIAQIRKIFGEVESVYMKEHHSSSFATPDIEGTMVGVLCLENGVPLALAQTCESKPFHSVQGYKLFGDRGSLRAWGEGYETYLHEKRTSSPQPIEAYPEAKLTPYAREMEAFADYVDGSHVGPTTGESERRSLAVVEAGYLSARTGKPVDLASRYGRL
jgi:predicted dehydrogenase